MKVSVPQLLGRAHSLLRRPEGIVHSQSEAYFDHVLVKADFDHVLVKADQALAANPTADLPSLFAGYPLDQLGRLMLDVPERYPHLRAVLPRMPSDEVQRNWTGASGDALLRQSCAYVRSVAVAYGRFGSRPWTEMRMLDHGCGWGRLIRLFYKFVAPERIWGLDPWDRSIQICRETGVLGNLAVCDYLPEDLPVGDARFDLISAFSVFTHLSERCHSQVLAVLRRYVADDGLLALTIRPPDYWKHRTTFPEGVDAKALQQRHAETGFAFIPHNRKAIDGDVTYGDTSISFDYIEREWKDWRVVDVDLNAVDPYQAIVFLKPA